MLNYQKIQENDLSQTVGINVELKKSQYFHLSKNLQTQNIDNRSYYVSLVELFKYLS